MEHTTCVLNVLGVDIVFKSGANFERARQAAQLVEHRFAALKKRNSGGQRTEKDQKTFLVLELADDLLQTENKLEALHNGIAAMLEKIEKNT